MKKSTRTMMIVATVTLVAVVTLVGAAVWRSIAAGDFHGLSGLGVPADKADYVGPWTAPGHIMSIAASGQVHYERHDGGVDVTLDLPVQKFSGDDFVIGALFWTTTFPVTPPPHLEDKVWRMMSDGVTYSRK